MATLELEGVSKAYGDVRGVEALSLSVMQGELVTILGPSGSGKSTTLRLIAGLEAPSAGTVRIDGNDMAPVDPRDRGVSMVFQSFALFPHLNVAQNIGFGLQARHVPPADMARRVNEIGAWLGLSDLQGRRPSELSGGERQRVALARALVRSPRILLMDEPLSNLDARLRVQTRAEIKRVHRELGTTIVYVTHDQAEALSLGDRVGILEDGHLLQCAAPQEVYDRPASTSVASFLGSPPMNLLAGRVVGDEVVSEAVRLPLPGGAGVSDGASVVAGFRPEAARIGEGGGGFQAVVETTDVAGHDRVWYLRAGSQLLAIRPAGRDEVREGQPVSVSIPRDAVRLFDPDHGQAI